MEGRRPAAGERQHLDRSHVECHRYPNVEHDAGKHRASDSGLDERSKQAAGEYPDDKRDRKLEDDPDNERG